MLEINCPDCLSSNILEDRQVARDINCITCGATFFVEKFVEEEPEITATTTTEDETGNNIIITTGPPPFNYEVIDTIIVLDTLSKNYIAKTGTSAAFEGIKKKLRKRAATLDAEAVINCHFDYRTSAGHGIFGVIHDLEIFAYGTLVRRS